MTWGAVCWHRKFSVPLLRISVLVFSSLWLTDTDASMAVEGRTWKYLHELSDEERRNIDPRADTPRDATLPYLPAEPYPFTPPYTAEEMGLRAMEFPHIARWNFAMIEDFGSVTPTGYLATAKTLVLSVYPEPEGLVGYFHAKPGEVYARWLSQDTYPPENLGNQLLMMQRRTDRTATTKTDMFAYSPVLRRVRRFPQPRRQDRFPDQPMTFDDFLGRDAWEFTWRILGTDILSETVRFPAARDTITLASTDGALHDVPVKSLKLMGEEYPYYTPEGGVPCYVLEARAKPDWLPDYYAPRILYWVDQQHFYPLRTEQYGPNGELVAMEVRLAALFNPAMKEFGYQNLITIWWNAQLDFLAYGIHDAHKHWQWTDKDKETYFNPDFMRRVWFPIPLKTQATVRTPADMFLRPRLYREKFPDERQIVISPEVDARIQAQDAAGRLVFNQAVAEAE
jgi:hypothetical protein